MKDTRIANRARIDVLSTGSLKLDHVLRTGGIERGSICEISGESTAGKTTLCNSITASAQYNNLNCVYVDVDYTYDVRYAEICGVDANEVIISQPQDIFETLDIIHTFCQTGSVDLLVVDSISNLTINSSVTYQPKDDERVINEQLSNSLQKISPIIEKNKIILIFTRRTDAAPTTVYHKLKHNPSRLALKLHSSLWIDLSILNHIDLKDEAAGQSISVRVLKNKYSPYIDHTELDIIYSEGIRITGEILDLGVNHAIIRENDNYFTYNEISLGSDRENAIQFLRENPTLAQEIERKVRQELSLPDIS